MHRAAVESVFGLQLSSRELYFTPCLPSHWPQAELTLRREGRSLRFILKRATAHEALAATAAMGAQQLRPGQALRWTELPDRSRFVIPLSDLPAPAPIGTHASASVQP
jgi:cyclic beta-1,2-glucan synthetase